MFARVLHISDLHFSAHSKFDRELIKDALVEHVRLETEKQNGPHAIFVTGDVANAGKSDELAQASTFFDRLLEAGQIDRSHIFVVPGNHDVDRTRLGGLGRTLSSMEDSDSLFCNGRDVPQIVLAQAGFVEWYNEFFVGLHELSVQSSCSSPRVISAGRLTISVSCINSAVFSQDDHDHGKLWLGRRSVAALKKEVESLGADYNLALLHHPLDWLSEVEQSSIKALLQESFHVLCSGHLHETDYSSEEGPSGTLVRVVAGASYQSARWPKRAHWLKFDEASVELRPIRFEEVPRPVWTTDPSLFPHEPGHTRKIHLNIKGTALGAPRQSDSVAPTTSAAEADPDLFTAPDGTVISIEPRLCEVPQDGLSSDGGVPENHGLAKLLGSNESFLIHCPLEHGATQLARRLARELTAGGKSARVEDAIDLPNYDKKIQDHFSGTGGRISTLIVDNFIPQRDGRLLRGLQRNKVVDRLIILVRSSPISSATETVHEANDEKLQQLYLWGLDRARIRKVAEQIFSASSADSITAAVNKTYDDLLGLAIPLTPSNVVMYLHILWRERDFQPLDRVHILERYIREVLSSPSDAFSGAFNVKNKLTLASLFVKELFDSGKCTFAVQDWTEFCSRYSSRTLVTFDASKVLLAFEGARLFIRVGRHYHLRYSFLYSYLVGYSVSNRPSELERFLDADKHYELGSVVETITALSTENTVLLKRLTDELEGFIAQFRTEYIPDDFDPLAGAQWPDNEEEAEALWERIQREIDEGPVETEKLDEIKTSLIAESRSLDQQVVLKRFSEMEDRLFSAISLVEEALKNSDDVDGAVKARALKALYSSYLIVLQIGTLLSDFLATRRFYRWGGLAFINTSPDLDPEGQAAASSTWVIPAVNVSVNSAAADKLGSKKLGSLFTALAAKGELTEFESLINLGLILRTKPSGWSEVVEREIKRLDRRQYRLSLALRMLRKDYREELNHQADREELKHLMALVQTKRTTKTNSPGNRAVGKMLTVMEGKKFFDSLTTEPGHSGYTAPLLSTDHVDYPTEG